MNRILIPLALLAVLRLAGADESLGPPEFDPLRYSELYDYLRDSSKRNDWWEKTKLIYLDPARTTSVSVGTETRVRYELLKNDNWGLGGSDGYEWVRELPYVDVKYDDRLRLFSQLIFAESIDQDSVSPVDRNRADLLQGFLAYRLDASPDLSLNFQVGRQLLRFGSGRLVDVRYGPNVLQPFDAAKAALDFSGWHADLFYSRPVQVKTELFDDKTNTQQELWGVYAWKKFEPPFGRDSKFAADFYYFGYRNDDVRYEQGSGAERRHTFGSRLFGNACGWDWNYEFFVQAGRFDIAHRNGNILAWSAGTDTGYTLRNVLLQPRAGLKANIISGDKNPRDGQLNTFNPLFPKGKYFGELTPIGPENLIDLQTSVDLKLCKDLELKTSGGLYWRESTRDAIYDVGRHIVRPGGTNDARFIGTQFEVLLSKKFNRNIDASASYSEFHAGQFVRQSGPGKTIKLVGVELMFRF